MSHGVKSNNLFRKRYTFGISNVVVQKGYFTTNCRNAQRETRQNISKDFVTVSTGHILQSCVIFLDIKLDMLSPATI